MTKFNNFKGKVKLGVGANVAYSTTRNISKEKLEPFGFSGDSFTVAPTIEYAFFGVAQYAISPRFDVQLGVGYSKQSESIFIYPSVFFSFPPPANQLEKHLEISASYLSFPLRVNWGAYQQASGQMVWVSGGITPNILLNYEDNYPKLIYHLVGLGGYASKFVLNTELAITSRHFFSNNQQVDFSLYGSISQTQIIGGGWGFLTNLSFSKNLQLGVQMKYFFGKSSKNLVK
jgi:hypothetical protein